MATHTLTENYRASKAVLEYVNQHNPSGPCPPGTDELIQCDGNGKSNPGLVNKDLNEAEAVKTAIKEKLKTGSVALLCRYNKEVNQWMGYLKAEGVPVRLIQEGGMRVHRLWPIWNEFHGFSHLHPVPISQFRQWCVNLGLVKDPKKCPSKCDCVKDLMEKLDYNDGPNQKVAKIKKAPPGCPKKKAINGLISSDEEVNVADKLTDLKKRLSCLVEKIKNPDDAKYDLDLKYLTEEFKEMCDLASKQMEKYATHGEIWRFFEDYYNKIENNLPIDKVILSTIHKAKGCEFDTVFLQKWNDETRESIFAYGRSQ